MTNCIPFGPLEFGTDDFRHHRTQYPFRLAYASTVHRSQGKTLDQFVVDLGEKEACPGLSFVALSRVRHVSNLAIFDFSFDRLKKIGASLHVRQHEDNRLRLLAAKTLQEWNANH